MAVNELASSPASHAAGPQDEERRGLLTYPQFVAAVRRLLSSRPQAGFEQMGLRAAFHKMDGDDSNYIDFVEFLDFVRQVMAADSSGAGAQLSPNPSSERASIVAGSRPGPAAIPQTPQTPLRFRRPRSDSTVPAGPAGPAGPWESDAAFRRRRSRLRQLTSRAPLPTERAIGRAHDLDAGDGGDADLVGGGRPL